MSRLDWDTMLATTHNMRVVVNLLDFRGRDVLLADGKTPVPPLAVPSVMREKPVVLSHSQISMSLSARPSLSRSASDRNAIRFPLALMTDS